MQDPFTKYAVVLLLTVGVSTASQYLAEKPPFLTPCQLEDPNFGKCLSNNFQVFFREWKGGIPGLKSVGSIDPLNVKRVKFAQDGSSTLQIDAEMRDVNVRGISSAIIKESSYDPGQHVATFQIHSPKLRFDFDYKLNGRILTFNLNSIGKGFIESENVDMWMQFIIKPRSEHGLTFVNLDKLKVEFRQIGNLKLRLDNLFNGQKELEESTNALFNSNWREFYEVLRPAIEQTVETVLLDRFKKALAYIPATYFIENFH